jgi:hypothetical protein
MAGVRNVPLQVLNVPEADYNAGTDAYLRLPKLVSHEQKSCLALIICQGTNLEGIEV